VSGVIRVVSEGGGLRRIVLDRPPGNVIDIETLGVIRLAVSEIAADPSARLIVFEGAGPNFSYGASVAEHLPERVGALLPAFRAVLSDLESAGIPTASIVRGHCLGGGLELAAWCGRVFCEPTAVFGSPEVDLAVFPPIAAILLPWRVGGARATQMILSGERIGGERAAAIGLADVCADDPDAALRRWFEATLLPKSSVALRFAWKAARRPLAVALARDLPELERLYLDELMAHDDPREGIRAFLEKRLPVWTGR
jgi:cyclohexa-1,5-dienecarbonyl-CoA hydratase